MSERARMLGERVELRQDRRRMDANCVALRERLRGLLPPEREAGGLDADAILDAAAALHGHLGELRLLEAKLAILDRELGR